MNKLNEFTSPLCSLCPNDCKIDRNKTVGACGEGSEVKIAKYYLHKFEEPCISGEKGSGAVFFCGCSLRCVFCQNYSLSRAERGKTITVNELADVFRKLEDMGAANVNLVTPTHYADKIAEALDIYKPAIPIVYNTHGYEKIEVLKLLDDYVDVYMPDLKYFSPSVSMRYTGKKDYFDVAIKAIEFMANKPLVFSKDGMMKSGTLIRHLVLPQNVEDSKNVLLAFSESGLKDRAYINVMSQYTPFGNTEGFPELGRKITKREYATVIDYAISLGIEKMFYQKFSSASEEYIPQWDF